MILEANLLVAIVAVVGTFLFIYIFKIRNAKIDKFLSQTTGPPRTILLGNALQLMLPHEEITQRVQFDWPRLYGPRYTIMLGQRVYFTSFIFSDVEKLLSSSTHLEKGDEYKFVNPWLGDGLLTSSGSKWSKRRKMLTPSFHFKILEEFMPVFNEQSSILVNLLKKDSAGGQAVEICIYITTCTLDIICETAMGKRINAQKEKDSPYVKAIYGISALMQHRSLRPWLQPTLLWNLSPSGRKQNEYLKILHGFTDTVIRERKSELAMSSKHSVNTPKTFSGTTNKEQHSESDIFMTKKKRSVAFMDLLLSAQADDPASISDLEIREETDTFMFEGHDTTAASLAWTIFLLGCYPEHQEIVASEIHQIFGDDKTREITTQDLTQMRYMECCIKESLRLYPSVPFIARMLNTDLVLDENLTVPKGVNFALFPMQIHRNPELYPEPEVFKPERFFLANSTGRHPYAYVPFSAGPRNCIGQKFAMMEEKVILGNLIRHFQFKSMDKQNDVVLLTEIILRPKDGLKVKFTPRKMK